MAEEKERIKEEDIPYEPLFSDWSLLKGLRKKRPPLAEGEELPDPSKLSKNPVHFLQSDLAFLSEKFRNFSFKDLLGLLPSFKGLLFFILQSLAVAAASWVPAYLTLIFGWVASDGQVLPKILIWMAIGVGVALPYTLNNRRPELKIWTKWAVGTAIGLMLFVPEFFFFFFGRS